MLQNKTRFYIHWNENVILMKFSSLITLEVIKMTTSSAASDEKFVKMTFSFHYMTEITVCSRGYENQIFESTPAHRSLNENMYWHDFETVPDSRVHEANMGPIWGRQDPIGPHVGPMNFAIWGLLRCATVSWQQWRLTCFQEEFMWYIRSLSLTPIHLYFSKVGPTEPHHQVKNDIILT